MKDTKERLTLHISERLAEEVRKRAQEERRTVSAQVEVILEQALITGLAHDAD